MRPMGMARFLIPLILLLLPAAVVLGDPEEEPPPVEVKPAAPELRADPAGPKPAFETVPYREFEFTDVSGPPEISCKEALGLVPDKPPVERPKRPLPPPDEPEIEKMVQITVGETAYDPARLPGANIEELPVQLLEGRPADLARVGRVMRRMAEGERTRMSFFGASHTGGDWFTGHIRRVLQGRHGDLGHGFILPAALYRGYRGSDINLCRTEDWYADWWGKRDGREDGLLGFAGMSVSSEDPDQFGWIQTTVTNKRGRKVSYYDIYLLGQPKGGTLLVGVDESDKIAEIPTHLENGEIALLRARVRVPDGAHRMAVSPKGDGEVRIFGVFAERDGKGVLVDAMGIRGRTAKTWLNWNEELFGTGMVTLAPDLVVLAYGTNEASHTKYSMDEYRTDLRAVLAKLRRALPDTACILVGPSDRGIKVKGAQDTYAVWDRTEPVAQVQREVAPEQGCVFWDWQKATGGPGSSLAWRFHEPQLMAKDLIHFTKKGYEVSADKFLEALEHAQKNSFAPN